MRNKPIPGQSLTTPPGKAPFERPPEINSPKEALDFHLTKLAKPRVQENMMKTLMLGVDVKTLTEGLLRNAVGNGLHSIDVSLMIAPVVHKYIVTLADEVGVEYEEGLEDTKGQEKIDKEFEKAMAYERADVLQAEIEAEVALGSAPKEEPMEEEAMPEPAGLMRRREA